MSKKHPKYDFLIVGAGLFGSTFASLATRHGKRCIVVDKRNHIGGNCYSENLHSIEVHKYGPHIFHTSDYEVMEFVCSHSPIIPYINSPVALYKGMEYSLPFNLKTYRQLWGVSTIEEAKSKIKETKAEISYISSVEDYALSNIGSDLFEVLVKGYTQKQWGRPCNELPATILKRIPLRFEDNCNYFDDTWQGFPKYGYNALISSMLSGSNVMLGVDFLAEKDNLTSLAKKIVYSGRLDEYFNYCLGKLEYRSIEFRNELFSMSSYQKYAVINHTSIDVPYTRTTEYKKFGNIVSDSTVVCFEYPKECTEEGDIPCYPIPTDRNEKLSGEYKALANTIPDFLYGGRLADYKYYNMDTTIAKAMQLWRNELKQ